MYIIDNLKLKIENYAGRKSYLSPLTTHLSPLRDFKFPSSIINKAKNEKKLSSIEKKMYFCRKNAASWQNKQA